MGFYVPKYVNFIKRIFNEWHSEIVKMTISLVKAFMTHAPAGWNIALEIDVLFPLPDAKFTKTYFRRKLHHKQKREFWERLQNAIDYHNLNGRACIMRSICEARNYLAPPGKSLVHDLLRAIFTAPIHEEEFTEEVADMYNEILDPDVCDQVIDCPFSLLHFVLTLNKMKY
ncbi:uncharacterized protein LOC112044692 isoform X2 [Bicyclus anynana]|uniref:Uncharacterized protein LOC112044692 isoform X2 n=1 Tax=Bicyclus anynana TaxID=110368 RepID=A0A6J1MU14_BICAN|nr:uncharacterized protein LOC112044692 isoform X2 [Bicyclus anynana]